MGKYIVQQFCRAVKKGVNKLKIVIEGTDKEIADFVEQVQSRQESEIGFLEERLASVEATILTDRKERLDGWKAKAD